jgi:hypothetical protein
MPPRRDPRYGRFRLAAILFFLSRNTTMSTLTKTSPPPTIAAIRAFKWIEMATIVNKTAAKKVPAPTFPPKPQLQLDQHLSPHRRRRQHRRPLRSLRLNRRQLLWPQRRSQIQGTRTVWSDRRLHRGTRPTAPKDSP